ncbi:MAG: hypothetical protein GY832_26620 [Chloroflexi bacterium]|nr:hypothetical protein [Chloroflexota bacterium]
MHITRGDATGLGGVSWDADVGGGVYVYTAAVTISNCVVYNNVASTVREAYGGGLCFNYGNNAVLNGNTVENNTATTVADANSGGGGLYLRYSDNATLKDNTVRGNTTSGVSYGGGLLIMGSDVTLSNNTIENNTASTTQLGYGGGMALTFGTAILTDNTIISNTSSTAQVGWGGGLYFGFSNNTTLSGNIVRGNTASTSWWGIGGGLRFEQSNNITLSSNTILGNVGSTSAGGIGGGLSIGDGAATLSDNIIVSNTATLNPTAAPSWGGGLSISSNPFTLTNNLVASNHANTRGSGLWIVGSSTNPISGRLLHTTIANNRGSGRGVSVGDYTTLAFTNTIIAGHHGMGITVTAGSTATLEATLWYNNGADTSGKGTILTGTANITNDPTFVNTSAWDYHLTAGSAAIDAGVNVNVTTDIDGQHRPYGSAPDLGADEIIATSVPTDTESSLVYTDTQGSPTVIHVPAGAVTTPTTLVYTPVETATAPSGFSFASHAFDLDAYRDGVLLPDFTFDEPVTLTIHYTEADVAGLDEGTLDLRYWNGSAWATDGITLVERNTAQNYVVFEIVHLSEFALFASALPNQIPNTPSNPVPADGANDVPSNQVLSWQGGDPDGDLVTYTIVISASGYPPVVDTTPLTRYTPSLVTGTTYYWAITATDDISTVVGPTWSFTTAVSVEPFAAHITKSVVPTGAVDYGDELTYTLVITAMPGDALGLYDPLSGTTFLRFVEPVTGVVGTAEAISGTLSVTSTAPLTVSFVARVGVPGTVGLTVDVNNRACVYPAGKSTLLYCVWSNTVTNDAFHPYNIYLPLVIRNS